MGAEYWIYVILCIYGFIATTTTVKKHFEKQEALYQ